MRLLHLCLWDVVRGGQSGQCTATELDDVLRKMHEVLDEGRTAAAIEAARKRIGDAADVEQFAHLALHERRSVYEPAYNVPGRA